MNEPLYFIFNKAKNPANIPIFHLAVLPISHNKKTTKTIDKTMKHEIGDNLTFIIIIGMFFTLLIVGMMLG